MRDDEDGQGRSAQAAGGGRAASRSRPPATRSAPIVLRDAPRGVEAADRSGSELQQVESLRGARPGDRYLRLSPHRDFRRAGSGHLIARDSGAAPTGGLARALALLKRVLIGRPLMTAEEPHERVNVFT